jgi:hypothetical protein
VQTKEFLSLGETLEIVGISDVSKDDNNPLSAKTSALYREYLRGSEEFFGLAYASFAMGATDTNPLRVADAGLLQKAIWKYQGQEGFVTSETVDNNKFVMAVEMVFSTWGNLTAASMHTSALVDSTELALYGGTQILNLKRPNGEPGQDQVYYPGSITNLSVALVPEPSSWALFAIGMLGAEWIRRRRRASSLDRAFALERKSLST